MKRVFRITSILSISLFFLLWILSKTTSISIFDNADVRLVLVLSYLFISMRYYQIEVREKNELIEKLNHRLSERK